MVSPVRKPLISIPSSTEDFAIFRARLIAFLGAQDTHVYVDTSFLMWLTKIGSGSRQELFTWLTKNCPGRVHVPIWAAHEYVKHYVAGTIITDLSEKTDELADLVGRTYAYFRPFIDEPAGQGAEDPSTIRAETRAALSSLTRLTAIGRQWQKSYQKHSAEVIAFINASTPENTSVYDDLKDIAETGAVRYAGSVPPGFEDRRKKGSLEEENHGHPKGEAPIGSNRFGDLSFWKEVLTQAKHVGAKTLLILTNDRKNDWHLGRGAMTGIDPAMSAVKKSWRPIPRPHPMLALEARLVAEVEHVELLDSPYLAALLRESAEQDVRKFADVAIVPDEPEPTRNEDGKRTRAKERLAAEAYKTQAQAVEQGHLFADGALVHGSRESLARALYESRQLARPGDMVLLESWRASAGARLPLSEALTAGALSAFNHKDLARLARELHDCVIAGLPGYDEALADLVSLLERLPPNTAAAIYLGLLASMYFTRGENKPRLPPASPVAQMLLDRQSAAYASNAIKAVAKRIKDSDFQPLYIPNVNRPKIAIAFDIEPDTTTVDQLRSLRVGVAELLTPAQADPGLKLRSLFEGETSVTGRSLIRKACQLFALPEQQIEEQEGLNAAFTLADLIGFKRPSDIAIPKEGSLDN